MEKIIPQRIIDYPKYKSINLHPSLLPRYRGPSPIHYALLHGDKETGISIMQIDSKMDHGPLLSQIRSSIADDDTYITLSVHLAEKGAHLLVETIKAFIKGEITLQEQNHKEATYTELLTKKNAVIDWRLPQQIVYNRIRALNPWPGTYTMWNGSMLKIIEAACLSGTKLRPGEFVYTNDAIYAGTLDGDLKILILQREGKTVQKAKDFTHGNPKLNHSILPN